MPLGAFKAALMGTAGVSTASVVLLSSQTASNSASLSFTSGIDSTYGEYIFKFYNLNAATDETEFTFQCNATDSTSYDETITSTVFRTYHQEDGSGAALGYLSGADQAQGTAYQDIAINLGNAADESLAGELHLFNPSSTSYVKHFYGRSVSQQYAPTAGEHYVAGYINNATAIDDIQFKMSSGNFDGKIKMWGVK
jgi:hypothetical protein